MAQLAQRHVAVDPDLVFRDGTAQQGGELGVRNAGDLTRPVMGQIHALIGVRRTGTQHHDLRRQADVGAGSAHAELIAAAFDLPAVGGHVPVAVGLVVQRDGDGLALARFQPDLGKALELLCGAEDFGVGLGDVELDDLGTGAFAGVGHGQGHAFRCGLEVFVSKGGVAQAVAEGEGHGPARRLKVAVAHIQALAVLDGAALACEVVFYRGIAVSIGPSLGQLAAGADRAGQHVHQSARTGLTAQAAVDQRLAVFEPRGLQRGACAEQDDHVGVDGSDRSQQIQLVLRQLHVHPVEALALLDLVQTHAEQDDVGVLRQRDGFLLQILVSLALAVKALGIADIG